MAPARVEHQRILVVDDNFILSETLSVILGVDGFRVCAAANGAEALERLRGKDKPCLVLPDLMMPGMDGYALLQERQRDKSLAAIPVVVVSGADDAEEQAAALGACCCLHKPINPTQLLAAVHRFCCQETASSGAQPVSPPHSR